MQTNISKEIVRASFLRKAIYNYFFINLGKAFTIAFSLLLARIGGVQVTGIYYFALAVVSVFVGVGVLGLDLAVIKFVSHYRAVDDKSKERGALLLSLCISVVIGSIASVLLYVCADYLSMTFLKRPEGKIILKVMSPAILLGTLTSVLLAGTRGLANMKYTIRCEQVLGPVLRLISIAFAAAAGPKNFLLVLGLGFTITSMLIFCYAGYGAIKLLPIFTSVRPNFRLREFIRFWGPLIFSRLMFRFGSQLNTFFLSYFGDASVVGVFNVALRVANFFSDMLLSIIHILNPMVGKLYGENNFSELKKLLQTSSRYGLMLGVPLIVLITAIPAQILGLFGPEFVEGSKALLLLALAFFVGAFVGPSGQVILMSGSTLTVFFNNMSVLLLNLVLCWLFIPAWGLTGAGLATFCSLIFLEGLRSIELWRFMKLHPFTFFHARVFVLGSLFWLGLIIYRDTLFDLMGSWKPILQVPVLAVFCFIVFWGAVLLLEYSLWHLNFRKIISLVARSKGGDTIQR